jgi:hypothetical protein
VFCFLFFVFFEAEGKMPTVYIVLIKSKDYRVGGFKYEKKETKGKSVLITNFV